MPAGFDACRKGGGKIRTIQMKGGRYMHVCILEGKTYKEEVKKKVTSSGSPVADAIAKKMG